ncbi:uncharacterized protein LOC112467274 [Temnothorax curvispinosus]|uniref:Uncharacterized protein LOC112467274 n=1 Tax=Temnothorax curvispinosus TaxID=300111 RepID=A0A6J1RFJ5_9HYME|nr:uncharacterized protein LOC112467274 [Temnothorax curvispinosus]
MVNEFRKHNYNVTVDILDRKMRNMKKTYRTIKDNQKSSSRGRITWEFFETFENIFFDDKTMNIGPTLSSMQCIFQPNSEQTPKQRDSVSSDNYDLISVPSRDLTKPHYDCNSLSKDSTASFKKSFTPSENSTLPSRDQRSLSRCSILPSTDSRQSSIDSKSAYDSYDSIMLKIVQIRMIHSH